jgi:hypothetical protein
LAAPFEYFRFFAFLAICFSDFMARELKIGVRLKFFACTAIRVTGGRSLQLVLGTRCRPAGFTSRCGQNDFVTLSQCKRCGGHGGFEGGFLSGVVIWRLAVVLNGPGASCS